MVRHGYGGAHFVPMAVTKIWLTNLESNKKLSFFKINSIDSRINSLVKRCQISKTLWNKISNSIDSSINSLVKRCEIRFCFLIIQYSIASRPSLIAIKSTFEKAKVIVQNSESCQVINFLDVSVTLYPDRTIETDIYYKTPTPMILNELRRRKPIYVNRTYHNRRSTYIWLTLTLV